MKSGSRNTFTNFQGKTSSNLNLRNTMSIRKKVLKTIPYIAAIIAGLIFYFIGQSNNGDIKGLLINISAAFFAIPLIFLFYQVAQNLSNKRLNKEISDYSKMLIDREMLSIINQLHKMVYPLQERDFSEKSVNEFFSLSEEKLKEELSSKEYPGFVILKKWEVYEENLNSILKHPLIVSRLADEWIISIITIIKSMRDLDSVKKIKELYIKTHEDLVLSHKVVSGKEINEDNIRFPDRYLLMKHLHGDDYIVVDFGDFALYNVSELLHLCKINEKYLELYTERIFNLSSDINDWAGLTGSEFIIDTKMFRLPMYPNP